MPRILLGRPAMLASFPKGCGVLFIVLLGAACATAPGIPAERQAFDRAQELLGAGQYLEAIPFAMRALALREEALGGAHPAVAESLDLLAELHRQSGDYTQAAPLLQRALAIREAALGPLHPDIAQTLNTLSLVYSAQDAYSFAEPLSRRALAIREATLGPNHPDVAQSLNTLANHSLDQERYDQAEPLYQRAIAIREATLGSQHPAFAQSLNNLATLYTYQGRFERAEPMHQRALAIREAALGPNHPDVAQSLRSLAYNYTHQGKYALAEPLYLRALSLYEDVSPLYLVAVLRGLAELYTRQGAYARALPHLERLFEVEEAQLWSKAIGLSESRLAFWMGRFRRDEEPIFALARARPGDERVRRLALTLVLSRKARSAQEFANISHVISRSLSLEDRERFEHLRVLRTRLATLTLRGPDAHDPAAYPQQLQALTHEADALEAELSRRSAPLRTLLQHDSLVERVAAHLPREGVLVEYVSYQDKPLAPSPGTPPMRIPSVPRYLAFLLFADGRSRVIDLGPSEPIERSTREVHDALASRAADLSSATRFYELAFRPLLAHLGETQRLFLAPDGRLSLVPFDALHDGSRFLVDVFDIVYLTSGKDLLPREGVSPANSVVVIADPDFNASAVAGPVAARSSSVLVSFYAHQRALSDMLSFSPLAGTLQEAEAVQRIYPHARLILGEDATKASLLGLATPGILHIATHGFFLEDTSAPTGTRALGSVESLLPSSPLVPPDPLLRSGLVLAGARVKAAQRTLQDAVVTGLELAGMDLWGTQLVVLSACDTGRGEVMPGQGVYGLRRALVLAGAETVVTSLWKVQDDTTSQLMTAYYQHLKAGQGRISALRGAMRALRERYPHPFFWAPFIGIGQDTPLRGVPPDARPPQRPSARATAARP